MKIEFSREQGGTPTSTQLLSKTLRRGSWHMEINPASGRLDRSNKG